MIPNPLIPNPLHTAVIVRFTLWSLLILLLLLYITAR
jgi:hypothetical protein